jgi:hypothetical protein
MRNRWVKIWFLALLVGSIDHVMAFRSSSGDTISSSHIRGIVQSRTLLEHPAHYVAEVVEEGSNKIFDRMDQRRIRRATSKNRIQRDRRLGKAGMGGKGGPSGNSGGSSNSSSSGSSGVSGGSGGSGSSSGSGNSGSSGGSGGSSGGAALGWDDNGNYCGCLCNGWNSENSAVSCDYAVHAGSIVDTGGYVSSRAACLDGFFNRSCCLKDLVLLHCAPCRDGNGEQRQDGQNDGGNDNGQAAEMMESSGSEQQQGDVVAVVSNTDSDYDPYQSFQIAQCDTYSHLWMNDIQSSCGDGNCQCTFAQQLISQGRLLCSDASYCPTDCPVCLQCLRQICGSGVIVVTAIQTGKRLLPAAVLLITLLLAGCSLFSRKKSKEEALKEGLMESETVESELENWMVPVSKVDGLPMEKSEIFKPVWLAPATFPVPAEEVIDPHFPKSKRERKETVMLVVVPKPSLPVKESASRSEKTNEDNIFPDLLKETNDKSEQKQYTPSEPSSTVKETSTDGMETEEFSPGLWVVPLSSESVASSLSGSEKSVGSEVSDLKNVSLGTTSGCENDGQETCGEVVHLDGPKRNTLDSNSAHFERDQGNISGSSSVSETSTISSLDDDRSIGSLEGEI